MADEEESESSTSHRKSNERPSREAKKLSIINQFLVKNEINARFKQIREILRKVECERTAEELSILEQSPDITRDVQKRKTLRTKIKERVLEKEDPPELLKEKCHQLAGYIRESKNIVVYTGAGISTAASIPDYRGPNGVWTMLQKGQQPEAQDLSDAEPTLTHMSICKLHKEGYVKHVVSQNCDGLHLRSGMARHALSEVHGNMYVEVCHKCKPQKEYVRLFDVTEKTGVRRHNTSRKCHKCGTPLKDTIVHFGEKGGMKSPYRWKEGVKAVKKCDTILCLGSSLKILKRYACLWSLNKRPKDRPKLLIVNLQWTPKDETAVLKINGKCDDVMKCVMDELGLPIPVYQKESDPIYRYATSLCSPEMETTSKKILKMPLNVQRRTRKKVKKETDVNVQRMQSETPVDMKDFTGSEEKFETIKTLLSRSCPPVNLLNGTQPFPPLHAGNNMNLFNSNPFLPLYTGSNMPLFSSQPFSPLLAGYNMPLFNGQTSGLLPFTTVKHSGQNFKCQLDQHSNISMHIPINCMHCSSKTILPSTSTCSTNVPFNNMSTPIKHECDPHLCDAEKLDTFLQDHCYLKPDQMQKLSPNRQRTCSESKITTMGKNSKTNSKLVTPLHPAMDIQSCSSSVQKCLKFEMDDDFTHKTQPGTCPMDKEMVLSGEATSERLTQNKTVNNTEMESNEEKDLLTGVKRKLCRSQSVPGWFGKGLNMKKKRKF